MAADRSPLPSNQVLILASFFAQRKMSILSGIPTMTRANHGSSKIILITSMTQPRKPSKNALTMVKTAVKELTPREEVSQITPLHKLKYADHRSRAVLHLDPGYNNGKAMEGQYFQWLRELDLHQCFRVEGPASWSTRRSRHVGRQRPTQQNKNFVAFAAWKAGKTA